MIVKGLRIVLDAYSTEMVEWLEENLRGRYLIVPHMIRTLYAGPNVPLERCQSPRGYEILFQTEEEAMAFKLRWS